MHHLTGRGMLLEPWVQTLPRPVQAFLHGGYVAVGTFFVLSGFVLARTYIQTEWNSTSLLKYGLARVGRVYPVYLLSLVLILPFVLEHIASGVLPAQENAKILSYYGFVLQGWTGKLPVHWNTPAWSLSCEFFFYLCFPIVAAVLCRFRWAPLATAIVIPLALSSAGVPNSWKPLQHLADFLMGIAASEAFDYLKRSGKVRGYWLYLPAGIAAVVIVANPHWTWHWMVLNTALRPFNATMLVGLALGGGVPVRALSHAAAEFLGRASYSMYILHIPILWWYKRTWFTLSGKLTATSSAMVYLAAVIGISAIVCQWFEEPANRVIRRWATSIVPVPGKTLE